MDEVIDRVWNSPVKLDSPTLEKAKTHGSGNRSSSGNRLRSIKGFRNLNAEQVPGHLLKKWSP